jgi:hypothetical protein
MSIVRIVSGIEGKMIVTERFSIRSEIQTARRRNRQEATA